MNRWIKLGSLALVIVMVTTAFASSTAQASEDTMPNASVSVPGPRKIIQGLTNALLTAAESATKLDKTELMKQLHEGKTLAEVITANGATVDAVKTAAKADLTKQIAQAVTDKKITQAQADKLLARLDGALDKALAYKYPTQQSLTERRLRVIGYTILIKETITETKLSRRDLTKQIRDGKTLAQIAQDHKIDPAAIVTAAVKTATDRINSQQKNGKLTDAQAKALLGGLQSEFTKMMGEPILLSGRPGKAKGNAATPAPTATPGS